MMKKTVKLFFVLALLLTAVFAAGCLENDTGGNQNHNGNTDDPPKKDTQWYFLDNLNYNSSYSAYGEGAGFLIYDEIDFSTVQLTADVDKYSVNFDISIGEEKNQVGIQSGGFGSFIFRKAGQYDIRISGKDEDGADLADGRLLCNVAVGNRPDRVEYTIKNSGGEVVDKLKGGDSYTVSAKLFCQQTEYPATTQDAYWRTPGTAQAAFNFADNIAYQQSKTNEFFFFIRNNKNNRIRIFEGENFTVYDNLQKTDEFPQGIYYSYGEEITDGRLQLNVDSAQEDGYFYKKITAEYRFDNGGTQSIELADKRKEGALGMFISYEQEAPRIYSVKDYDFSTDAQGNIRTNYFSNGVKYQFQPDKSSAKIYLAVWRLENNQYVTAKVEGTDVDLTLISEKPSAIAVTSVSGKHKDDTAAFSTKYKEFTKSPTSGSIDVYLCCDMDGDGKIEDEYYRKPNYEVYQYFVLNIVSSGGNLKDYSVTYSYDIANKAIHWQQYDTVATDASSRYFIALTEGTATITIASEFSDCQYTLIVNVVNKVFDGEKRIYSTIAEYQGFAVFSTVELREFLKIKEYRLSDYNANSYTLRAPREDEVFVYSKGGQAVAGNEFGYENNGYRGQEIRVTLQGTAKYIDVSEVYIIPDFAFTVNGKSYRLKELTATKKYEEDIDSLDKSEVKSFFGRIPVLNVEGEGIDFAVTDEGEMQNRTDIPDTAPPEPRYAYKIRDNKLIMTYLFYYTLGNKTQVYKVEILNISLS